MKPFSVMKRALIFIVISGLLLSCARDVQVKKDEKGVQQQRSSPEESYPVWFYNPGHEGYLGAVGMAKKQERGGYAAQKRLAVTIAQAELARQIEVFVNSDLQTEKTIIDTKADQYYKAKLSSLTTQETYQLIKNAVVKDEWVDPKTENLYLWVVIDEVNP